jgi:spore coat polysaccharide biosynthesis predicted glycosyltransferase SpsG
VTTVVIVADGGAEVGLGHVSRATGLAAALGERGIEATSVVLTPSDSVASVEGLESAGVVVLDSYRVSPTELPGSAPVAVFNDVGEQPNGAALVIDGANFELACLRPAFWDLPPRVIADRVESVVVATGAGGELGASLAAEVRRVLPSASVVLVRGPYAKGEPPEGVEVAEAPESLAELLRGADLAVVAAGQTMLEAVAAGTPTVAVVIVENQRRQAERLAEVGAAVLADWGSVAEAVEALVADPERRRRLSAQAQAAIDGQGARRIAALVAELA